MSAPTATDPVTAALEEGLAGFWARDLEAAHRAFERAHRRDPRHLRAMSWYGVTLVLVERNLSLGVSLCDQALRPGPDPELLLNLARVHLALNQRERAVKAVERGLQFHPGDEALQAALSALGTRRAPVLPLLGRSNPLNRMMGRIRHRWARRHGPAYELSPLALGSRPDGSPSATAPAASPDPVPDAAPDAAPDAPAGPPDLPGT